MKRELPKINWPIPEEVMLGTKIRERRLRLNLSLGEVSELTGISVPHLSQIENNHTPTPSFWMVGKIMVVLGIPIDQFFLDQRAEWVYSEFFMENLLPIYREILRTVGAIV